MVVGEGWQEMIERGFKRLLGDKARSTAINLEIDGSDNL